MNSRHTAIVVALGLSALHSQADDAPARLDWVRTVYSDGRHNAFTDLAYWKDQFYVCFRHGAGHASMDGEVRVMRSTDLERWELCATLDTFGDDRDGHFAVTGDRLFLYVGTWDLTHREGQLPDRNRVQSYVSYTDDGVNWSTLQGIYKPPFWVWRVRRLGDRFYGVGYTALRPKPETREAYLVASEDGIHWSEVSRITNERQPSESDLMLRSDGTLQIVTRMEDAVNHAFVHRSKPPYSHWESTNLNTIVHAPALVEWKDRTFVGGRARQDDAWVTRLWELNGDSLHELITLPSGGDTSYPGIVLDPASTDGDVPTLLISWYSQHNEDRAVNRHAASIYLGRVVVGPR